MSTSRAKNAFMVKAMIVLSAATAGCSADSRSLAVVDGGHDVGNSDQGPGLDSGSAARDASDSDSGVDAGFLGEDMGNVDAFVSCTPTVARSAAGIWSDPTRPDESIAPGAVSHRNVIASINESNDALVAWASLPQCNGQDCPDIYFSQRLRNSWTHPMPGPGLFPQIFSERLEGAGVDDCGDATLFVGTRERGLDTIQFIDGAWQPPVPVPFHGWSWLSVRGTSTLVFGSAQDAQGLDGLLFASEFRNRQWIYPRGPSDAVNPHLPAAFGAASDMAMSANGNVLYAWYDNAPVMPARRVYLIERDGNVWRSPELETDFLLEAPLDTLRVALSGSGDAIVAGRITVPASRVFAKVRRNGVWLPELYFGFEDPTTYVHDVAMNGAGDALVVWSSRGSLYASEWTANRWLHPDPQFEALGPFPDRNMGDPVLAMAADGYAVVVWGISVSECRIETRCGRLLRAERVGGQWLRPNENTGIEPGWFVGHPSNRIVSLDLNSGGHGVLTWIGYDQDERPYVRLSERN